MKQDGKISFLETSLFTIGIIRFLLLLLVVFLFQFGLSYPALMLVLVLLITELGKWWSRYGIRKIEVEAYFYPPRLFAGEDTVFKVQLHNQKLLPVILDYLQPLGEAEAEAEALSFSESDISFNTLLLWRDTASRQFTLKARQRGYYELPAARIVGSDGMGFYSTQLLFKQRQRLVVYPRIVPLPELGIQASDLIGEKPDRRYIMPDPVQVAGLRPYTPDIPARLINWKASAHQDTMMARVIEPSADYKLCLILDVEQYGGQEALFEAAVSVMASIAMWADEEGFPFGVLINGVQKGSLGPISVPVASGFEHTSLVMEKLARLTNEPLGSINDLLHSEGGQLPWGCTLVIIGEHGQLTSGRNQLYQVTIPKTAIDKGFDSL